MATNFPTTLDDATSIPVEAASTTLATNHVTAHQNIQDAIEAIEAKLGVNSSAVTTSHDYKLSGVTSTDKAVSLTGTESLTNKTLGVGSKITLGSDATGDMYYRHTDGTLKRLAKGNDGDYVVYAAGVPSTGTLNDASTTVKGLVEEGTLAETLARTGAGGTAARLFVNPTNLTTVLNYDYVVDTGTATAYAIAPTPAVTAYVTGQKFTFKAVNANTSSTPTLAVSGLASPKTIINQDGTALGVGQITANSILTVIYDGTNMIITSKTGGTTPSYFEISSPILTLSPIGDSLMVGFNATQSNPTYLWFGYANASTLISLFRLDRQSSGNYIYKGVTTTIVTTTNNNILGITEMGGKLYVRYTNNSTRLCNQYATDLTGVTAITGFGTTNITSGMCTDPDGVTIWTFDTGTTNLKSYTISGTTATNTSTVTLSVAISGTGVIFKDVSGNFYSTDKSDGTTIQKWNSSGTNQASMTTRVFNYVSGFEHGTGWFKCGSSIAVVSIQKLDAQNTWSLKVKALDLS